MLNRSGGYPSFRDDEIFIAIVPLFNANEGRNVVNEELRNVILEFICNTKFGKTRKEINEYIYPKISGSKSSKNNKIRTTLTYLRKKQMIVNIGSDTNSVWVKK